MMETKQKKTSRLRRSRGFTLIEVIAVLIILGIISAVAISRVSNTDIANQVSELDILKNHLRYAQLRALSDDANWEIDFQSASYTLYTYNPNRVTSALPSDEGMGSPTHTLSKVSITQAPAKLSFNPWGIPTATGGGLSITLSGGQSITITPNTGFIP